MHRPLAGTEREFLLDTDSTKGRLGDANVGRALNDESKWVGAIPKCFGLENFSDENSSYLFLFIQHSQVFVYTLHLHLLYKMMACVSYCCS